MVRVGCEFCAHTPECGREDEFFRYSAFISAMSAREVIQIEIVISDCESLANAVCSCRMCVCFANVSCGNLFASAFTYVGILDLIVRSRAF